MDQEKSRQGQERIHLLDALRSRSEELGQSSGRDDARLGTELAGDTVYHAVHQGEVTKVEPGLNRSRSRLPDDTFRSPDLYAPEPRRLLEEVFRRNRDARHDDAARVFSFFRHDVEGRRRSE